jgi:hypothetical protein
MEIQVQQEQGIKDKALMYVSRYLQARNRSQRYTAFCNITNLELCLSSCSQETQHYVFTAISLIQFLDDEISYSLVYLNKAREIDPDDLMIKIIMALHHLRKVNDTGTIEKTNYKIEALAAVIEAIKKYQELYKEDSDFLKPEASLHLYLIHCLMAGSYECIFGSMSIHHTIDTIGYDGKIKSINEIMKNNCDFIPIAEKMKECPPLECKCLELICNL